MIKLTIFRYDGIYWFKDGNIHHNNNGPAAIHTDGSKAWYANGVRHRLDGPAIELVNKRVNNYWYIDGVRYDTELEYWVAVQNYDRI